MKVTTTAERWQQTELVLADVIAASRCQALDRATADQAEVSFGIEAMEILPKADKVETDKVETA